jgi:ABC-type nitrate/sulfonate/bicarbonate transport system permease component
MTAFGVILLVWSIISAAGWVKPINLPAPWRVGEAFVQLMTQAGLWKDLLITSARALAALALAVILGVPFGLLLALNPRLLSVVEGPVHALRSIPAAALFPLFLIVIGVGEGSIITLATYNSVMVVLISTVAGAVLANRRRVQQARSLGLGGWRLATQVLFWEALPHIFSGVRVAAGYGLALIIAVEMFLGISHAGLGRKIYDFQAAYRMPECYAAILVTATVGVAINAAVSWAERRCLRWLPMTILNANEETSQAIP